MSASRSAVSPTAPLALHPHPVSSAKTVSTSVCSTAAWLVYPTAKTVPTPPTVWPATMGFSSIRVLQLAPLALLTAPAAAVRNASAVS